VQKIPASCGLETGFAQTGQTTHSGDNSAPQPEHARFSNSISSTSYSTPIPSAYANEEEKHRGTKGSQENIEGFVVGIISYEREWTETNMSFRKLLFVLIAFPLAVLLPAQQPFSRSHWIAENSAKFWFSESVLASNTLEDTPPPATFALPASAPAEVQISHDIFQATTAQPETESEPTIAINPRRSANLVAGYQEARFANGGAEVLGFAYSFDHGAHWKEGIVPDLTIGAGGSIQRASDPWLAFGPHNDVYFASIAFNETDPLSGIYINVSENGGKRFKSPVAVIETSAIHQFNDKVSVVTDTSNASPGFGNVYVCWDQEDGNQVKVLVARSTDHGNSFGTPAVLQSTGRPSIGIIALVDSHGNLFAIWLSLQGRGAGQILLSRSSDAGITWTEPAAIARVQENGVKRLRTGGLPATAIDKRSGAIYVVWPDSRFTKTADQIAMTMSTDGGSTWSAPKRISDGPPNKANFTPAVAVNSHGEVAVSYYSLRNDPRGNNLVDELIQISTVGGQTFLPAVQMSSHSFDVRFAARARRFFLGDYQGLAAASRSFHPVWVATMNASQINPSRKQPDVFTTRYRN
jgi:Neuraminidase (sialidase)